METLFDLPFVDKVLATFFWLGKNIGREIGGLCRNETHGFVFDYTLLYVEVA